MQWPSYILKKVTDLLIENVRLSVQVRCRCSPRATTRYEGLNSHDTVTHHAILVQDLRY